MINHFLPCLDEALADYHSPGSDVQRPVHDHDELDVQFVALGVVPARFVAHKRRILLCVCKKMRQSRGVFELCLQW